MNRWFGIIASISAIASLSLVGCAPTEDPAKGSATTAGSGETKTDSTTGTTSGTGETGGTTEPQKDPAKDAVSDMPKDGEDVAVLDTSAGKIVLMFYPSKAPKHVENFMNLAKKGFYNGTRFHRCMPGFMIQGGDPLSKDMSKSAMWGTGGNKDASGKEVNIAAEFNDVSHTRGILSAARSSDPNSASSQFFIMVADNTGLDGQYSVFGKAVSGMDVVDKIVASGNPDPAANGAVDPAKAYVLKSVTITKWPVK